MRANWVRLAGLAVILGLGAGCSSSGGGTSSSSGSGSTGSGTSAGTSGGTTTGGSSTGGTTGGGGKADGAACAGNAECTSALCGVNDSSNGHCCTAACSSGDATCGAKDCDTSGACAYPPSTHPCGASTCTGNTLSQSACDGAGACVAGTPTSCPSNLLCNGTGACFTQCTSGTTTECVTGFYCSGGHCLAQLVPGQPCTSDVSCTALVCGVTGTGNCCTARCDTTDPSCGATVCDGQGACVYPTNSVQCRASSCSGDTLTEPAACNGAGKCPAVTTADCTPYACTGTPSACATSCSVATGNSACASGDFCDTSFQVCCTGLANGGTIAVDGATGSDAAQCCGIGANAPCQTLSHAMVLIDAAQAKDVTIVATMNGGGGDWTSSKTYPVTLGWGVELSAPGVFFPDPGPLFVPHPELFDIATYSINDTVGYASIAGSAQSPVGVGMNSANSQQTDDIAAIQVESGVTLYLANASVNGSFDNPHSLYAFFVSAGATLVLGQDRTAAITGTVTIGNALGDQATDGKQGIYCASDQVANGCTITDAALKGPSSVVIQGQENGDIIAEDFSSITLTSNPMIGVPPSAVGFNNCPQKNDAINGAAVWLDGQASLTFNNGVVQCIGGTGFLLQPSPAGNGDPTLGINAGVIQNTEVGISGQAGTATITNTTINYNVIGVEQLEIKGKKGSVNLAGGGNTVICSSNVESSQSYTFPGIDVYNASSGQLNAGNVAWDTASPDFFDCDETFSCTCNILSCTTAPGSDDMDAVEDSSSKGGITTTGATQSTSGCN